MKLSLRNVALFASLAGAVALAPSAVAFADDAAQPQPNHPAKHRREHREGLLGAALRLPSLTADQRSSIEELARDRRAASVPVRQSDARVLTELAQQVEQANVDANALAGSLNAERAAATALGAVEKDGLTRLHTVLTPAQRNQLVDELEAAHTRHHAKEAGARRETREGGGAVHLALTPEQRASIRANLTASAAPDGGGGAHRGEYRAALESFRNDSFDPSALVRIEGRAERTERLARAMVPVLTPAQRATFAARLRARAAHESS